MKYVKNNGEEIKWDAKMFIVTLKNDMKYGKLTQRGDNRLLSGIKIQGTLPRGLKVKLAFSFIRPDKKYITYIRGIGYVINDTLEGSFEPVDKKHDLYLNVRSTFDYPIYDVNKKFNLLKNMKINELTKTEKALLIYVNKGFDELMKIDFDKSMKYKIKNHTNDFIEKFVNKYENLIKVDENIVLTTRVNKKALMIVNE